jgi:uncharacterized protein
MAHRDLSGQTALITGGGTGIGRGIALALARRGVHLVLVGRRAETLTAVALEAQGGQTHILATDLSDAGSRASVWQRAEELAGTSPALLVHCAAQFSGGPFANLVPETIAETVAVNLLAPLELTRRALPNLVANQGTVVFISSLMSHIPAPGAVLYAATKAGVRAAVASLRPELETIGVQSLLVFPPVTDTPMVRGMAGAVSSRRFADPLDVGERIVAAIAKGRNGTLNLMSRTERIAVAAYAVAPALVEGILRRMQRRFSGAFAPPEDVMPEGETPCP